jgi:hypothetical protein
MISEMFRIALAIVLGSCGLDSATWAAICSNASVNRVYGYVGEGTDAGIPYALLLQLTYTVASNCTATGTVTIAGKTSPFSLVVTSTGGLKEVDGEAGITAGGLALAQGAATCSDTGI